MASIRASAHFVIIVGFLLTGMGRDCANGLLHMREAGARTIAQDEKASVVFGMPKEAIRINTVEKILALDEMPSRMMTYF